MTLRSLISICAYPSFCGAPSHSQHGPRSGRFSGTGPFLSTLAQKRSSGVIGCLVYWLGIGSLHLLMLGPSVISVSAPLILSHLPREPPTLRTPAAHDGAPDAHTAMAEHEATQPAKEARH